MDIVDEILDVIESGDIAACLASAPEYMTFGQFAMTDDGLTKNITIGNGAAKVTKTVTVSGSFEVVGLCRDPQGDDWGKLIGFKDKDGRTHRYFVADAALHGDAAKLAGEVSFAGLHIHRLRQKEFAEYLNEIDPPNRVTRVNRTGWHVVNDKHVFVMPNETIGDAGPGETVVFDGFGSSTYDNRGSLADWQAGVGAVAVGQPWLVLSISASLSGALMSLAGAEGGGVHFFGPSSIGKSTLLASAASVWGRGGAPGYVSGWRATANGLEGAAARATDTSMVLDELGVGDAREVAAAVYALANGAGKQRARRTGAAQEPRSWRVTLISSGELPVETKIEEDRGRKARAGQTVRLLDIQADRGLGCGVFDSTGAFADAAKLSDAVKTAATTAYGTAGPAFINGIIQQGPDTVSTWARQGVEKFVQKHQPAGASEQVGRVARRLGLIGVAGVLASRLGIAPWRQDEAWNAAALALSEWIGARGGSGSHEEAQAIAQVRHTIEMHGNARFDQLVSGNILPERLVHNRLGWRDGSGNTALWYVMPEAWKSEVCTGLDPVATAKTLAKHGMLSPPKTGPHLSRRIRIEGRPTRVYVIKAAILA